MEGHIKMNVRVLGYEGLNRIKLINDKENDGIL